MKNNMIGCRLSDSTINILEDIRAQYGMSDSDLLRIIIMFAITHNVELHAYIEHASKYIKFGKDKEKYEEAE